MLMKCLQPGYAEQFTSGLSLEDAIQRYTASGNESKWLGIVKDSIAAVDLLIRYGSWG